MKKAKVKVLQGDEWQIERNLVLKEEKVCAERERIESRDNPVTS